jgi:predicted TIM-barrel fold metal-dependent hydrolase
MRTIRKPPQWMQALAKARLRHGRIDGDGLFAEGWYPPIRPSEEMAMQSLVLSSDSHVFEPPDLWQTRIDAAFRDRAPRIDRIDGADNIIVEADTVLSGIGLISNAGARFTAPETISGRGRFEDVHRGGYDPDQHLEDMALDGVAGEVLYPSQGLFYFKVADAALMSAIFRAYNDWLAEFCRTDPARLKGIAMINLDDVQDGIKELQRTARLGLSGAMIAEYPAEDRRYDQPEYEPVWAAAAALGMPLSLHTATRRQGRLRGAGPGLLRDASGRATKAFYPALSMCDLIFSGVFERHPGLMLAIVEFELAWAPHVLSTMDYTYRERHDEAKYRFKNGMLPSDFFRRNVVLSFQEDAIGIRLRDVIGVDNMMWGSDYPHSESTFPQSQKILAEILAGVSEEDQAKIVGGNTARLYGFDVASLAQAIRSSGCASPP